ncbi:AGE family epimerase/isomerase [Lachnoclostridium sp. Marseille-P6806]|uniref:AGE family epimerase/isomerase n=1 Tax=Lachnoclostridium sp. Marseille-P6806 TaxID=2364793 RepID=UPI0010308C59|nr:AGE family epimerase/isomerase [Lachnoclostridium sp. Marseille-P6806]
MTKKQLAQEASAHLRERIIPFWRRLRDDIYGGYYGYVDYDLHVNREAEKGCILNSRIVWFFSRCFLELGDPELLHEAEHAFRFMREHCFDTEHGGVYWSVTFAGDPLDTTKHTYNQAFSIYALSEYYEASGDPKALDLAMTQFQLIESRMRDEIGYLEALDLRFRPAVNDKLSENDVVADRTMNTLLHVFEAYTNLYRVSKSEPVKERLVNILRDFAEKIWNPEKRRQEVFFDSCFHSLLDLYSYGHDIETSWLLDRGLEVLAEPELKAQIAPLTDAMADNLLAAAYDGHSLPAECERGVVKENRVWWVQAETVLGFLNAAQKHPEREEYWQAAVSTWEFIRDHVADPREGAEWFWEVTKEGKPIQGRPVVEPWKCPYHNGRMCLEVMRRLGAEQ